MSEDLITPNLETSTEEVEIRQITANNLLQKCFEVLGAVENALGIEGISDDGLIELESEPKLVPDEINNHPPGEKSQSTEEIAKQRYDLADLRAETLKAQSLTRWSHLLQAKSQQLKARSTELALLSQDILARRQEAKASKYTREE